ncbi:MAG: hypothetical protein R2792_14110 [Saprospiraceae bacterium]
MAVQQYGGGGGANNAGGGSGSSYIDGVTSGSTTGGVNSGAGFIQISYNSSLVQLKDLQERQPVPNRNNYQHLPGNRSIRKYRNLQFSL